MVKQTVYITDVNAWSVTTSDEYGDKLCVLRHLIVGRPKVGDRATLVKSLEHYRLFITPVDSRVDSDPDKSGVVFVSEIFTQNRAAG